MHYEARVTPAFQRYLYRPLVRGMEWLADLVRPVQSGDVNLCLLYGIAVILLAYLPARCDRLPVNHSLHRCRERALPLGTTTEGFVQRVYAADVPARQELRAEAARRE